jgi:UPF0716 family protein affecting phage T7 exclusion
MKWLIILPMLGVVEIFAISQLHTVLGTYKLVGLYLATTAIGAVFLLIQLPAFRQAMNTVKSLETRWKKRFGDPEFKPTAEDIQKLKPMVFLGVYIPAVVLIAIPGIVSDVVGTLLVLPVISNRYIEYQMNKAMKNVA